MKILITGTAGFIGAQVALYLLKRGDEVVGLDSINNYYDPNLKYTRLKLAGIEKGDIEYGKLVQSKNYANYRFIQINLEDREGIEKLFATEKFDRVCNLAAQAGVRYSIENPYAYVDANIYGFLNILESSRKNNVEHLVYASSSSVYGKNEAVPFSEKDSIAHPVSLYAATKKANELMAHTYSSLYKLPTTGLRFFTVYGPMGRPDMAPFLFTDAISNGKPIKVFNDGNMLRDFTYIDDIVEGVVRVIDSISKPDENWNALYPAPSTSNVPYKIYNIGNSQPVKLMDFIETIESELEVKAEKIFLPMQQGDVYQTNADTSSLENELGFKPNTSLKEGIHEFINWYKEYYNK